MKPERWQQLDQLFQAALERASGERAPFLKGAALVTSHCVNGFKLSLPLMKSPLNDIKRFSPLILGERQSIGVL